MNFSVHFLDKVRLDIREAKEWYKNKKPGLEKRFAQEIKKAIARIQKNPEIYELKYKNVRSAYTGVFPYSIYFIINDKLSQVVIIAILHQARNPALQYDRNK
ncbi:type II toxin-antitoxin system RelE/ParE family toxin [Pedobacter petrophilus]|uniref:Type II toxin-antitoxin system RelE/ParE family toxin n=1 Tax=Pedobacter petrophilus TaxID=1908241 RepID=A0A7K0FUH2_9SPHI|nr:type II toxin-antitoxin system RelE/ParE family toxin [Pedobacter petrophilus]MRX74860.1 type II toxin-antitoxin system RelE/ParE family toxin [Pedobacter petrophilus]